MTSTRKRCEFYDTKKTFRIRGFTPRATARLLRIPAHHHHILQFQSVAQALWLNAGSGSVMQASLKRTQQTALNFQPQKKIRTEPDPEPMEVPKAVRPANAQPVKKLVIKNLKGI